MSRTNQTILPLIRLDSVTKSYSSTLAIDKVLTNVSLEIFKGEKVAIVGPSGSGKTTLIHIIGGLLSPTSGTITIDGAGFTKKSDKFRSRYRNQHIGFVFQNYNLLSEYTVLENVCLPLTLAGWSPSKRLARARRCLQLVGMQSYEKSYANQLSGGQKQRVSIARALVHQPDILIADEPTGNLDSKNGQKIADLLQALNQRLGITLLLVTHNQQLAAGMDRILLMQDGKLQEKPYASR